MKTDITKTNWFAQGGAYGVVDGQFGSTGKGLVTGWLARQFPHEPIRVTTSAGPNSGHTFYHEGKPHVLTQLPTYAVQKSLLEPHRDCKFIMNAGSVIVPETFKAELDRYPNLRAYVHLNATVVSSDAVDLEESLKDGIGSTGKGTGAAMALKIMRTEKATVGQCQELLTHARIRFIDSTNPRAYSGRTLVEVSQGFSLGINQQFYPYCTSRECSVGQGIIDAGVHPSDLRETMMVVRTFPIRVGGNSGPGYLDQKELSWDDLKQTPERTTVTNKVRRVFTWSQQQFHDALVVNRPRFIFLNFCNYLEAGRVPGFAHENIMKPYKKLFGSEPEMVLLGFGPEHTDVRAWDGVPF